MRTIEATPTFKEDLKRVCQDRVENEPLRTCSPFWRVILNSWWVCRRTRCPANGAIIWNASCNRIFSLSIENLTKTDFSSYDSGSCSDFECRDDEYDIGFSVSCGNKEEPSRFFKPDNATTGRPTVTTHKKPTLAFALFTLLSIVTIIACGMIFFKLKLHLLMMSCWVVCALFARRLGYTYTELEVGAYELIQRAMGARHHFDVRRRAHWGMDFRRNGPR